ncbi:hypothetical protein CYLTODRAFT_495583 [Cylindrobasidium torrendii FP15055 ss-10]|uniref:Uncharacterized protein n=1 Tax=Cylindrobasidium torrendii FP15055 ss-10 TaxID=1314674 RepID=A0A0D7ARW5_9AGAR|nr:hypothetical protein CYLTODRAFT_495583 [Cylindrobasidium torrendii FP15055 ss-10]
MPFTKKIGRPRKYATKKEAKHVARERRLQHYRDHAESISNGRKLQRQREASDRASAISWSAPDSTPTELLYSDGKGATPAETVFRGLQSVYTAIQHTYRDGDPVRWFDSLRMALQESHGHELNVHLERLEHLQHALEPYFRALEVSLDTLRLCSEVSGRAQAERMVADALDWRNALATLLNADGVRALKTLLNDPLI